MTLQMLFILEYPHFTSQGFQPYPSISNAQSVFSLKTFQYLIKVFSLSAPPSPKHCEYGD